MSLSSETRRARLLAALMDGGSVTEAAKRAGVSRTRAYELMGDQGFRDELNRLKREALDQACRRLQSGAAGCADALVSIATDEANSPQIRVNAASAALSNARAFTEVADISERLEALEELTKSDLRWGVEK